MFHGPFWTPMSPLYSLNSWNSCPIQPCPILNLFDLLPAIRSHLRFQGFPSDFLNSAAPYLQALPNLKHLHFKPDSSTLATSIGCLPPSLETLELESLWVGGWPSNLPR